MSNVYQNIPRPPHSTGNSIIVRSSQQPNQLPVQQGEVCDAYCFSKGYMQHMLHRLHNCAFNIFGMTSWSGENILSQLLQFVY